jgi:hypothetical protein
VVIDLIYHMIKIINESDMQTIFFEGCLCFLTSKWDLVTRTENKAYYPD